MSFWNRRRTASAKALPAPALFESLEQRLVLYSDPFLASLPDLSAMKNDQDTVVRFQTGQGFIDIELFDVGGPPAAVTTANFLNYVRSGRYDGTFFHRLVAGFVLQGGGYGLKDPLPASTPLYDAVQTDGPIVNEFSASRSNVERTISMAKLGSDPNSATSQFFFNLVDNSSNLDHQNGGFTVFGQVIGGWNVVTTISAFSVHNLDTFLAGTPSGFDSVPLSGSDNTDVVTIIDAEVIKRKNQTEFFTDAMYFPDGFRSGHSSATVQLVNPDSSSGAGAQYIIIARFETGTRDKVIAEGFIAAGAHLAVPIYTGGDPTVNRVRGGAPFGYEIRSSRPLAASINATDFGATTGAAFLNPATMSATSLQGWSFANAQKGTGLGSFLEYQNLSDQDANVTVTYFSESGTVFFLTKVVRPYRRGGLDTAQLPSVPAGLYSIRITSDQPLMANLSQYRVGPPRASLETGQISGFTTQGVLPGVTIPSQGQTTMTVLFAAAAPANITVDFDFILADGSILNTNVPFTLTTSSRRRVLDLSIANAGLPRNEPFTIRYHVENDAAPISAAITSISGGNTVTSAFQTYSSQTIYFGDGFTDPTNTNNNETISIFNPFRNAGFEMNYTVKFHFEDDGGALPEVVVPAGGSGTLDPNRMVNIRTRDLSEVMTRLLAGSQFRHYSITIEATFSHVHGLVDGAVFAQLTRIDTATGNTLTTGPTFASSGPAFFFTDPQFTQT